MADKIIDAAARISTNTFAFGLFALAVTTALVAHHGHDKDLLSFAEALAASGATLFRGRAD